MFGTIGFWMMLTVVLVGLGALFNWKRNRRLN